MLGELFTSMQQLTSELGNTGENNIQIQEQIESVHQKLEGANGKIEGEVHSGNDSFAKKFDAMKHEEPMVEAKSLKKPYVGDTRVEYKSAISLDSPPGLELGKGNRGSGL